VEENQIKFAVIVARYQNQWLFCRHKERTTWEIPGGHREPGEAPIHTAHRELFEETGAVDADISIVGVYKLRDYGLLCYAEVHELKSIPEESEIAMVKAFDSIPENLTYGGIHEQLFHWVQEWLQDNETTSLN
jgi:8-oxo-dGTP diphosphatase